MRRYNRDGAFFRIVDFLHDHIIIVILCFVLVMSGISTIVILNQSKAKLGDEAGVEYKAESTIYLPMLKVASLNPITSQDLDTYNIDQLIYDGLFSFDNQLRVKKNLVESYTTSKEEGKISITLKDGVKFSDGTPLTSQDVAFTVDEIQDNSASLYYNYANKIDRIETGEGTLDIYFKSTSDASISNLTFPILSESSYDDSSSMIPVGTGKYQVSSYELASQLLLVPNEGYRDGKVSNSVQFTVMDNTSGVMGLMSMSAITGYMDYSGKKLYDAQSKKLKTHPITSEQMEYLAFNLTKEEVQNKNLRRAIAFSINTDEVARDNYSDQLITTDTIISPAFLNRKVEKTFDPGAASMELKKTELKDLDGDGLLDKKDGQKLQLKLIVSSSDKSRMFTADSIQGYLKDMGIDCQISKLSQDEFNAALESKDYHIALMGMKVDKALNLQEMFDSRNKIGYNNGVLLAKAIETNQAISEDDREKALTELGELVKDEMVYFPIGYRTYTFITVDRFRYKDLPTSFSYYMGIDGWKWEKAVKAN